MVAEAVEAVPLLPRGFLRHQVSPLGLVALVAQPATQAEQEEASRSTQLFLLVAGVLAQTTHRAAMVAAPWAVAAAVNSLALVTNPPTIGVRSLRQPVGTTPQMAEETGPRVGPVVMPQLVLPGQVVAVDPPLLLLPVQAE